ncbi:MAG TPA: ArsI/CadI family heavy metal resistance metalloenzyme [Aridibacter sp.]|nr:ArsI/CadI family heavy metal resistance metalloenzyme [Aridibacter sp.]
MKTHISLKVSDLESSITFYTKMLAVKPVKVKSDYAKFDVNDPPLNLTLNSSAVVKGGQLSHLGLQVQSTDAVNAVAKRWAEEGLITLEEKQTDCCYALQDKVWVADPDGAHWEVFTVLADTEGRKDEASQCCDLNGEETKAEAQSVTACC